MALVRAFSFSSAEEKSRDRNGTPMFVSFDNGNPFSFDNDTHSENWLGWYFGFRFLLCARCLYSVLHYA